MDAGAVDSSDNAIYGKAKVLDGERHHIQVGDEPLEDFIVYYFDDSIHKDGEKDWARLKAWLMAYYEMQATSKQ